MHRPEPDEVALRARNDIWLPTAFWAQLSRIARTLGVSDDRVMMFQDATYLRIKAGRSGSTKQHADVFHFVETTDLLARLHGDTYTKAAGLCVLCSGPDSPRFDRVCMCRACAGGPIPLYTAWVSLGAYQNDTHSLLEVVHGSTGADYSLLDKASFKSESPRIGALAWTHATATGVEFGDVVVFNAKLVHRARPKPQPRISLDVRFAVI